MFIFYFYFIFFLFFIFLYFIFIFYFYFHIYFHIYLLFIVYFLFFIFYFIFCFIFYFYSHVYFCLLKFYFSLKKKMKKEKERELIINNVLNYDMIGENFEIFRKKYVELIESHISYNKTMKNPFTCIYHIIAFEFPEQPLITNNFRAIREIKKHNWGWSLRSSTIFLIFLNYSCLFSKNYQKAASFLEKIKPEKEDYPLSFQITYIDSKQSIKLVPGIDKKLRATCKLYFAVDIDFIEKSKNL